MAVIQGTTVPFGGEGSGYKWVAGAEGWQLTGPNANRFVSYSSMEGMMISGTYVQAPSEARTAAEMEASARYNGPRRGEAPTVNPDAIINETAREEAIDKIRSGEYQASPEWNGVIGTANGSMQGVQSQPSNWNPATSTPYKPTDINSFGSMQKNYGTPIGASKFNAPSLPPSYGATFAQKQAAQGWTMGAAASGLGNFLSPTSGGAYAMGSEQLNALAYSNLGLHSPNVSGFNQESLKNLTMNVETIPRNAPTNEEFYATHESIANPLSEVKTEPSKEISPKINFNMDNYATPPTTVPFEAQEGMKWYDVGGKLQLLPIAYGESQIAARASDKALQAKFGVDTSKTGNEAKNLVDYYLEADKSLRTAFMSEAVYSIVSSFGGIGIGGAKLAKAGVTPTGNFEPVYQITGGTNYGVYREPTMDVVGAKAVEVKASTLSVEEGVKLAAEAPLKADQVSVGQIVSSIGSEHQAMVASGDSVFFGKKPSDTLGKFLWGAEVGFGETTLVEFTKSGFAWVGATKAMTKLIHSDLTPEQRRFEARNVIEGMGTYVTLPVVAAYTGEAAKGIQGVALGGTAVAGESAIGTAFTQLTGASLANTLRPIATTATSLPVMFGGLGFAQMYSDTGDVVASAGAGTAWGLSVPAFQKVGEASIKLDTAIRNYFGTPTYADTPYSLLLRNPFVESRQLTQTEAAQRIVDYKLGRISKSQFMSEASAGKEYAQYWNEQNPNNKIGFGEKEITPLVEAQMAKYTPEQVKAIRASNELPSLQQKIGASLSDKQAALDEGFGKAVGRVADYVDYKFLGGEKPITPRSEASIKADVASLKAEGAYDRFPVVKSVGKVKTPLTADEIIAGTPEGDAAIASFNANAAAGYKTQIIEPYKTAAVSPKAKPMADTFITGTPEGDAAIASFNQYAQTGFKTYSPPKTKFIEQQYDFRINTATTPTMNVWLASGISGINFDMEPRMTISEQPMGKYQNPQTFSTVQAPATKPLHATVQATETKTTSTQEAIMNQAQSTMQETRTASRMDTVQNMAQDLKQNTSQDIRQDLSQNIRQDVKQDVRQDIRQELRQNLRQDLRQDMRKDIRQDLRQDLRYDMRQPQKFKMALNMRSPSKRKASGGRIELNIKASRVGVLPDYLSSMKSQVKYGKATAVLASRNPNILKFAGNLIGYVPTGEQIKSKGGIRGFKFPKF